MRPQIHSKKHYVQMSRTSVAANAEVDVVLIDAQGVTVADQVFEVVEGASVKAVYIELWVESSGNQTSSIVTLGKFPSNLVAFTFTEMAALGLAANKNNVLFTHQGLASNDAIGNPIPVMRGWFKIPKTKQRFGLADRLILQIASQGDNTLEFCGFALYKEYT